MTCFFDVFPSFFPQPGSIRFLFAWPAMLFTEWTSLGTAHGDVPAASCGQGSLGAVYYNFPHAGPGLAMVSRERLQVHSQLQWGFEATSWTLHGSSPHLTIGYIGYSRCAALQRFWGAFLWEHEPGRVRWSFFTSCCSPCLGWGHVKRPGFGVGMPAISKSFPVEPGFVCAGDVSQYPAQSS